MAKGKDAGISYTEIERQIKAGQFKPVYYLMGEEPYYIDKLSDLIVSHALTEEERDFNMTVLQGAQNTMAEVVSAAMRYPMMAERQVVLVKDAQKLDEVESLATYLSKPVATTVLVFCNNGGKLDRRTKAAQLIDKVGVLYESVRLRENELTPFVKDYLQQHNVGIDYDACQILCQHIGSDLSRLATEMDKLIVALPQGQTNVDREIVAANTGINKDYNVYELIDALDKKDAVKAYRIVKYFDSDPKNFAIQMALGAMFKHYSDLLLAYYSPVRTEDGIAAWVGMNKYAVRYGILPAMSKFSARKVFNIIGEVRKTDAASKGVGGVNLGTGDLLVELVSFILH
ncbi:MAG: DNA polymerase III subunit delta [Bacteroidaceae bacterium]|nr:DNA polymerase III subunit delta [Bacteroidaceae bacterium]